MWKMTPKSAYQNDSFSSKNMMGNDLLFSTFYQKRHLGKPFQSVDNLYGYTTSVSCSFNGKEKDYESGFHYYGARYYWSELLTGWLSVDPMADKYPSISPYAYCAWNPVKLVDPDGMTWKDVDGNVITDHSKIKVYIFYDPKSFKEQSLRMYQYAINRYGAGSVALSDVTTEQEFAQDWHDMAGADIREVNLNYHGSNQALHLNHKKQEYLTSTETGKTNSEGNDALNISNLPPITGNINNAQLNINSCHSNKKDESLIGSKLTLMESFRAYTSFRYIRGTAHGVSYNHLTKMPFPGHSWWPFMTWDFMPEPKLNLNHGDFMFFRAGGMK
jgi:RHS repeat-associated protein